MPKGKAGEYAKYACNFYVGCSNDCDYCYCKRGVLGHAMGKPQATLKKCFKNADDAIMQFERELLKNLDEYRKHGIFFTFTSDPLLPETQWLTWSAITTAVTFRVPCKLLTKRADFDVPRIAYEHKDLIAFGFTLTGMDSMELNASTNVERISTMRYLHDRGFKTFASIEPVIRLDNSLAMIYETIGWCDLYKIGLLSGHKDYTQEDVSMFVMDVNCLIDTHNYRRKTNTKVYWKDSVLEFLKIDKEYRKIPTRFSWRFDHYFCVGADYNIFTNL